MMETNHAVMGNDVEKRLSEAEEKLRKAAEALQAVGDEEEARKFLDGGSEVYRTCPFCRSRKTMTTTMKRFGRYISSVECQGCHACGPVAQHKSKYTSRNMAEKLWNTKAREANRVLLQEEIDEMNAGDPVWHEKRFHEHSARYEEAGKLKRRWTLCMLRETEGYGKTYRCWLRKPTEEEKKNGPKWQE